MRTVVTVAVVAAILGLVGLPLVSLGLVVHATPTSFVWWATVGATAYGWWLLVELWGRLMVFLNPRRGRHGSA